MLFPGGDVTAAGEEVREAGQALGIDKRAELGPVGQGILIHTVEVSQALGGLGLGFAGTETARGVTVAIEQRRQIDNLPAAATQGLHQLVAQEGVLVVAEIVEMDPVENLAAEKLGAEVVVGLP